MAGTHAEALESNLNNHLFELEQVCAGHKDRKGEKGMTDTMTNQHTHVGDDEQGATWRDELRELIAARSFQQGPEMTLASGRTSTIYFNMKPTMLHPDGARLISLLMFNALSGEEVDLAGGLEMGAVPIASALAAVSSMTGRPIGAFFVRKQAKDHGTRSLIEGLTEDESMANKRVVVVEDVTTTGGSALKAVETLKSQGAHIVCLLTVVDRQEGASEACAAAGVPFKALLTKADFTDAV